jgi:glycosyltransferase involved in cell wall biosynthesis
VLAFALFRARAIFTFTQFGKKDIVKHFKMWVNPEKIHVIPEGPGHSDLPREENGDKNLLLGYTIEKPYLLYVGNAYPHKNLDTLVNGFERLLATGVDWQLGIVGSDDDFRGELKEKCASMGLWKNSGDFNRVVFTGYVEKEVLATLYKFALLYVYPSFYEGFAFPVLEAMRYGVPVVCSNQTVLPEILGDSVEYFDPHNIEEMIETIKKVSNDFERQEELRQKGFECIQKYSWEFLARITLQTYLSVLTHGKTKIANKNS